MNLWNAKKKTWRQIILSQLLSKTMMIIWVTPMSSISRVIRSPPSITRLGTLLKSWCRCPPRHLGKPSNPQLVRRMRSKWSHRNISNMVLTWGMTKLSTKLLLSLAHPIKISVLTKMIALSHQRGWLTQLEPISLNLVAEWILTKKRSWMRA